jgi:hypothetical protein
MASEIVVTLNTLEELQSFPIKILRSFSLQLQREIRAWRGTDVTDAEFVLTALNVDHIIQETKLARKVVDDLANWTQSKQLQDERVCLCVARP